MFLFDTDYYLRQFQRIVDKMKELSERHDAHADTHKALAEEHEQKAALHRYDAQRARSVAKKIEDLIS